MEPPKLTAHQVFQTLNNGLMGWVASGMKKLEQPQSVAAATQAIEDGTLRFQTGQAKGFHEDIIFAIDPQRRAEYSDRQPWCAVIMCSDSLLSPETILDTSSRNLFVIRSAGNVIDTRAIGTLEHALEIYPIKVLVIIGHDGCSTLHYACSVGTKEIAGSLGESVRYLLPSVIQARGRNPKLAEQRDDKGKRIVDAKLLKYAVEFSINNVKNDIMARSDKVRHMVNKNRLDILCYMHHENMKGVDVIPRNKQGEKDDEAHVTGPKKSPEKRKIKQQMMSGDESDDAPASPAGPVAPGLAALAAVAIASPPRAKKASYISPPPRPTSFASPAPRKFMSPNVSAKQASAASWFVGSSPTLPAKRVGRPPSISSPPPAPSISTPRPTQSTVMYASKKAAALPSVRSPVPISRTRAATPSGNIPSRPVTTAPQIDERAKRSAQSEPEDALRPKRRIIANKDPFYEYL